MMGIATLAFNFPTVLLSFFLNFYVSNMIFVVSTSSLFVITLYFWNKLIRPDCGKIKSKLIWLEVAFLSLIWIDLVGTSAYFLYKYQKNPTFHLSDR